MYYVGVFPVKKTVTVDMAYLQCMERGAHLVAINSLRENQAVRDHLSTTGTIITQNQYEHFPVYFLILFS